MLSQLTLICVLGLLSTHAHRVEHDTGLVTSGPVVHPHLTGCRSSELVTFRCWWSSGSFWNLSESGALGLFFQMKTITPSEWQECPEYTPYVQNECYFSREFTRIWTLYCIQLRSTTHTLNITYDQECFTVENIVYPDPPVALNWTLLNVSRSGLNFDIMVRWAPPPSAEVHTGWMSLKYEVHYRVQNSSHWDKLELESGTQQSVYALHTGTRYELRVRCTMTAFKHFGDFSDSVFIHVPFTLTQESMFPLRLLLIVGVVVLLIFLILVFLSQQQRLMVILLPPVPAPKIKGIDPELLKKGKVDELNFLLSSHVYKPDSDPDPSWVEFIYIDLDEVAEKDESSDKRRLLDPSFHGAARCIGPAHKGDSDSGLEVEAGHPLASRNGATPEPQTEIPVQFNRNEGNNWTNMDFYAQVSDVTPAGGVVLTPEQHNNTLSKNKGEEEEQDKKKDIQLMVMDSDRGYSSEDLARNFVPDSPTNQEADRMYRLLNTHAEEERQGYISDPAPPSALPPLADYTVVQEVDEQRGILLNPSSASPLPSCPQNPNKCPPNMPVGYLTPELLENFSP